MGAIKQLLLEWSPALADYETAIIVALSALFLISIIMIVLLCLGKKSKGRTVCLLGLSDSGKTLLFIRLSGGKYLRTMNSIKENSIDYRAGEDEKPLQVVDVPGNERIRDTIFKRYKESLKAVIVVIDSYNFSKEARSVAELLYDLLSERAIHKKKASIVLACNKQDLAMVASSDDIRMRLEAEITALHSTRASKLAALDGGAKKQAPVKFIKNGNDFEFKELSLPVRFIECSARGKGEEGSCAADIADLKAWLGTLTN